MNTFLKSIQVLSTFIMLMTTAKAQTVIPLYDGKVPNSKEWANEEQSVTGNDGIVRISKVSQPQLLVYPADKSKANGTAVIICPGGGYTILAASHEGWDVAKRFNEMGVTAFVLKYRLPSDNTMVDRSIGPLQDAQRAIQYVRENAAKWNIKKDKIGIVGFSAGGHLASTAGTHFTKAYIDNKKNTSLRPDFMILGYPVISFQDSVTHSGSKGNLIGKDALPEVTRLFSNELQVTPQTPPTFLVHAKDDGAVNVKNTLYFADALRKYNIPVEVYLYEKGGHGFGMNNKTSDVKWMDLVEKWMAQQKLL